MVKISEATNSISQELADQIGNISISLPRLPRGLKSSSKQHQVQAQAQNLPADSYQPSMLKAQMGHDLVCRSASSSPRILRRSDQHVKETDHTNAINLNVPGAGSLSRKLSLQPTISSSNTQANLDSSFNAKNNQQQQSVLVQNSNTGSANNLNNLSVSNQHLTNQRKSIIGRLERSSFQAQRLSDVGVAFGQQITAKMGLKLPASQERIVEQTRWLYLRYVIVMLRQNALPLRDLNLTKSSRARRAAALSKMPRISCSAPATALPTTDTCGPFSRSQPSVEGRRRSMVGQDVSASELSDLVARIQNKSINFAETISSSGNLEETTTAITDISNGSTSRKFKMDPTINRQIFSVIVDIIRELRELKPDFYGDSVYELIGVDKFSSLQSLLEVQMTICQEMTRSEISWCRIVALFCLFGAMSLDCVRLGTPEHVGPILDGFIGFVERDLAFWISQQGGWESFLYKYRAGYQLGGLTIKAVIFGAPILIYILFKLLW